MTFYKAVEQQNANPQLTPLGDAGSVGGNASHTSAGQTGATSSGTAAAGSSSSGKQSQSSAERKCSGCHGWRFRGTGYFVQVAAVSKQDDADALVDALKKKEYPAFVAKRFGY